MALTFYGYSKCSTCRNALKWLNERGHEPEVVDIIEQPPVASLLKRALTGGYALGQLFNRSGELYRSMNIKDRLSQMSEAEALKLLSEHGKLVKRPVVTDGKRVTVGFDEAVFESAWGKRKD